MNILKGEGRGKIPTINQAASDKQISAFGAMPYGGMGRRYSTGINPNHTTAYKTNDFVVSMSSDGSSN